MDEKDKGRVLFSMRIQQSMSEHGPVTKIFYHRDVGLVLSTFKGLLQVYDSMEFKLIWETSNA
jgi:hypothetical protein